MTIDKPSHPRHHEDRFDECQLAVENELIELVCRACDSGWHRDEVLAAIIAIADNLALARREHVALAVEMYVREMMKKRDV